MTPAYAAAAITVKVCVASSSLRRARGVSAVASGRRQSARTRPLRA